MATRSLETVRAFLAGEPGQLLKARGFRKRGLVFERQLPKAAHYIGFQLSAGNTFSRAGFYVKLGITLKALRVLRKEDGTEYSPIGGTSMDYEFRIARVAPRMPDMWVLADGVDPAPLSRKLTKALGTAIDKLDAATDPSTLLEGFDLERGFDKILRAKLHYVLGEKTQALADVRAVAMEFSDRHACTERELLARAGLRALAKK